MRALWCAVARSCASYHCRKITSYLSSPLNSADLIYQDAFVGRAAIAQYFQKIERLVPPDIKFVVEDITEGGRKAGVRW